MPVDIADVIRIVTGAFFVLLAVALALAVVLPKKGKWKLVSVGVVLLVFGLTARYVVVGGADREARRKQEQIEREEFQQRLAKAQALFDEHCKTAGEKIYRTVEGVEGLLLMKLRPSEANYDKQYLMTDPYGSDFVGESYIESFLWGRNPDGTFSRSHNRNTYKYVEIPEAGTGLVSRYRAHVATREDGRPELVYDIQKGQKPMAKFGVTWDDISTKEDRDVWIAGSSLTVIDLKTKAIVAERIGYMFDKALGSQAGNGRSPWVFATYNACPEFRNDGKGFPVKTVRSRGFILKVVKPISGE